MIWWMDLLCHAAGGRIELNNGVSGFCACCGVYQTANAADVLLPQRKTPIYHASRSLLYGYFSLWLIGWLISTNCAILYRYFLGASALNKSCFIHVELPTLRCCHTDTGEQQKFCRIDEQISWWVPPTSIGPMRFCWCAGRDGYSLTSL